tara:strand:- start:10955 stop:11644 length:690 start_codon:yes stop_codon:yes gene_type:complete
MRERKSAEERKSEIIETTLRLADWVGPDRLSTQAIAKTICVTQATIFRHFSTKQALWEAVAGRIGDKFQTCWREAEDSETPATDKLQALIISQLKLIHAIPAIPAILLSRELHAENNRLRRLFYGMMERFHRRIARLIEEGQQQGHFRDSLDSADAAFLVISLVQGLVLRWSLSGRNFDIVGEGQRLFSVLRESFCIAPPLGWNGSEAAPATSLSVDKQQSDTKDRTSS